MKKKVFAIFIMACLAFNASSAVCNSTYNNGEWYSLTGDWINKNDFYKYNWSISRAMIHEFAVK